MIVSQLISASGDVLLQLPFESLEGAVNIAGAVILLVMLVALGGFVYRSLQDDGIRWPDETDSETEGVQRRPPSEEDDDEWKYY
jgi:hypothetical protein